MLHDLAAVAGSRQDMSEIADVLLTLKKHDSPASLPVQMTVLGGLADGTGRRGKQLAAVLTGLPEQNRALAAWAAEAFGHAAAIAADTGKPQVDRLAAVRLLAHAPWRVAGPVLAKLLTGEADQAIRLAAVGRSPANRRRRRPTRFSRRGVAFRRRSDVRRSRH